jgi:hypothetical protein
LRRLITTFTAFSAVSLLTVGVASAGSITASLSSNTSVGLNPGTRGVMTVVFNGNSFSGAYVGQINWSNTTGALTSGLNSELNSILVNGSFSTYCIEGLQDVFFGATETWNGVDGAGSAYSSNNAVVALSDAPNPGTHLTSTGNPNQVEEITEFWDRFHDGVVTDEEAAAFQLGIWEIVSDGNTDNFSSGAAALFGNGNFKASGDPTATNLAASWLSQLGSGSYNHEYTIYALTDGNNPTYTGIQDQIFAVPVPLPAALPAGLSLIGGLGLVRFIRKSRVKRSAP